MTWRERIVWTIAVIGLLACLAWAAILEPLLPDSDDCHARGRRGDCWKDSAR